MRGWIMRFEGISKIQVYAERRVEESKRERDSKELNSLQQSLPFILEGIKYSKKTECKLEDNRKEIKIESSQ